MDTFMKIRRMLFSVSFIYFLLFVGKIRPDMLSSPGDIVVVGMFEIFEPDVTQCGDTVRVNSVMYAEAIRWYFKKLNESGGIPFTIGFEAHKTCQIETLAATEAINLVSRVVQPPDGAEQTLIAGVIGPEYSSEAIAVSRVLSAVNSENQLLQVGFSATAVSLRDKRKHPNFLSVVPDDGVQTETIIQSMQHLNWNRVAIVYEDNVLGQEASAALTHRAEAVGICIAMVSPVDVKNGVSVSSISTILNDIIHGTGKLSAVNGYVFFGSVSTARVLFRSIKSTEIQSAPIALLSESIGLDPNAFKDGTGNVFAKTQGSLAVSPPHRAIEEFREYWVSIFTDDSVYKSAVEENPWLQHVARYINTTCETQACSLPVVVQQMFKAQPLYVQYAIFAAHALAVGISKVHSEHCGQIEGVCAAMTKAFKPTQLMDKLRDTVLNFATDFRFKLTALESEEVTMTLGGNNGPLRTTPDYEVFNFRQTNDQSPDFSFVKIGDLKGNVLTVDNGDIRDYPDGITETRWPDIRKAQCPDNLKCTECIPRDLPDRFVHVPGDVYVVGLVPIYDRSATAECDTIRTINGYQLLEALKFAVEKANSKTGIFSNSFKNIHVGLIVLNTCNNQIVAQRIIYDLHKNGLTLPNGEHIDLGNKILGFVGDVGSSISIAIAEALTRLRFVQISYGSTSPRLSDRSAYPYFLRVATPDDAQAKVMIDIVKKLDGNYIQIVYSKGAYGEGGLAKVLEAAEENGVCVISKIEVVEENANYYIYYEQLRKYPEAKIVIVFLRSHVVNLMMTVISEQVRRGEFVFIGSEAWARNTDVLNNDGNQILLGSFSVALELAHNAELLTYMTNLKPVGFNVNPWAMLYLQTKLDCYYQGSFDKSKPNACEDVLDFQSDPNFLPTPWATAAYNAMISLLIGAGNHLKTECGDAKNLCDGYVDNIEGLIGKLKEVQLDLHGLGTRLRVFNDNGDGNVGYILYNIQKDANNPQELEYTRVGQYPVQGNPTFSADLVVSPIPGGVTSVCPSEQACSSCFDRPSESEITMQRTNEQGTATIVLGVLFGLSVIIIIVIVIVIVRIFCKKPKEDTYLHPTDIVPSFERPPVLGSHQFASSSYEENFDYLKAEEMDMEERI